MNEFRVWSDFMLETPYFYCPLCLDQCRTLDIDIVYSLQLMTHIARIRGVFDVANSQRYRAGFAPMLFKWSHAHIVHFSSRIRCDFFPVRFFCPRPLFIVRFFLCRANFHVETGCTAVCFTISIDNGPIIR